MSNDASKQADDFLASMGNPLLTAPSMPPQGMPGMMPLRPPPPPPGQFTSNLLAKAQAPAAAVSAAGAASQQRQNPYCQVMGGGCGGGGGGGGGSFAPSGPPPTLPGGGGFPGRPPMPPMVGMQGGGMGMGMGMPPPNMRFAPPGMASAASMPPPPPNANPFGGMPPPPLSSGQPGVAGLRLPPPPPPPSGGARPSGAGAPASSKENRGEKPSAADEERRRHEKRKKEEEAVVANKERQRMLNLIPVSSADMSGAARRLELGDFVCPYHFGAGLPPLPADPKLLEIDFERASFVRFRFDSAVEMSAKYELLPEPDLGITIDLVDPEAFAAAAPGTELDAADEELLSASAFAQALGERKGIAAVAKEMRENVTFLRKTPIMSNNLYDSVNKFQKVNMESKPVLETSKHLAMTTNTTRTLAQQIEAIEKSFDDAETINVRSSTLVHPSDPSLTPVSSVPVLPDYAGWDNRYSIMTFDIDPSLSKPGDLEVAYARERIGRALCKGFSRKEQDKNEMYLAYMLPPAREEGADEALEEDVPLEWVREYQYTLAKRDTSAQDTYYL
eukprot:jgi/Chrpa1/20042/Chrysochromulina_OHIO_Genome00025838-RA